MPRDHLKRQEIQHTTRGQYVSTSNKNTVFGRIPPLRSPNILLLLTREKPAPVLMVFGLGSYSWEEGEKGERQSLICRTRVMAQFVPELVHGAPDRKTNNSQRRLSLPHTKIKKKKYLSNLKGGLHLCPTCCRSLSKHRSNGKRWFNFGSRFNWNRSPIFFFLSIHVSRLMPSFIPFSFYAFQQKEEEE